MSKGKQFAILLVAVSAIAFAQSKPSDTPPQTKPSLAAAATAAAAKPAPPPVTNTPAPAPLAVSRGQAVYLVRSTLMMLNDANRSGNYTVLRDLSAPDFQSRNSVADLALTFSDLRRRKFDFFAVSFTVPQMSDPTIQADGRVRLTGLFPTQPLQIKFDMIFQVVAGEWRLSAIAVGTPEAPKQKSELSTPRPQSKVQPFYGVPSIYRGVAGLRW